MPGYWLTFTPKEESPRGWPMSAMRDLIARVQADANAQNATEWWRIANRNATVGDRVYVLKQGTRSPRGIIGVGEVIDAPERRAAPTDTHVRWRINVHFQKLVDPTKGFLLPLEQIDDFVPGKLIRAQASGTLVPEDIAMELERRLAPVLLAGITAIDSHQADDVTFDPASVGDERERALRAVCIRRGQPAFRAKLMDAYDRRCAVTGCDVEDILEAAHISPYGSPSSNHICNGLLLRTDIHTLFNSLLLAFVPETRQVVLADKLNASDYGYLAGSLLREPKDPGHRPSALSLAQSFAKFATKG